MVNLYDSLVDANGFEIKGRTRLFIAASDIQSDGTINTFKAGSSTIIDVSGLLFIVDDYLIEQIDKVRVDGRTLKLKDGQVLDEPPKSDTQLQMEELQRQMLALQQQQALESETTN
ncbi:hypothetical protein [Macrococcus bovicus]|uniref:Uncharacterized protein n=1 Tax=Macrococcus bovicus TaxID=69968 RepID=A0A4R6C2V4_9STAP|nr:hypothetical protein [Macrococcus bovicus]TDM15692.1 hypothetical protein ERX55_01940 [Macrococcus bovicus]